MMVIHFGWSGSFGTWDEQHAGATDPWVLCGSAFPRFPALARHGHLRSKPIDTGNSTSITSNAK